MSKESTIYHIARPCQKGRAKQLQQLVPWPGSRRCPIRRSFWRTTDASSGCPLIEALITCSYCSPKARVAIEAVIRTNASASPHFVNAGGGGGRCNAKSIDVRAGRKRGRAPLRGVLSRRPIGPFSLGATRLREAMRARVSSTSLAAAVVCSRNDAWVSRRRALQRARSRTLSSMVATALSKLLGWVNAAGTRQLWRARVDAGYRFLSQRTRPRRLMPSSIRHFFRRRPSCPWPCLCIWRIGYPVRASRVAKMLAISAAFSVPQVHSGTIAFARLLPSGVSA